MSDDPFSQILSHTSDLSEYSQAHEIFTRQVILRDHITCASIVPFHSQHHVPSSLMTFLTDQFNAEISKGDTYPFSEIMTVESFAAYWFQNFGAVMFLGKISSVNQLMEERDWLKDFLGSFYIKPNYPGRSSHICNAGFLVALSARNRGIGRILGETYIEWAPKLGYSYSVFNLVYETNLASCRIWDSLGFKRIGRIKGAGKLRSYPGQLIDAIIFGRDLGSEGDELISEERFDKIKFYLKYGKYPAGADRSEKSRLRSAATHYKFDPVTDKLLLKDKEVISDPQRQYEITRNVHMQQHGGINKTTATITEKYHWVRIKETVSLVIRNCDHCKELGKTPNIRTEGGSRPTPRSGTSTPASSGQPTLPLPLPLPQPQVSTQNNTLSQISLPLIHTHTQTLGQGSISPLILSRTLPSINVTAHPHSSNNYSRTSGSDSSTYLPLDPLIMNIRTSPTDERHKTSNIHDHLNIEEPDDHNISNNESHHNDNLDIILGIRRRRSREESPRTGRAVEMSLSLDLSTGQSAHRSVVSSNEDLDLLMEDAAMVNESEPEDIDRRRERENIQDAELVSRLQAQAQAAVEATQEILIAAEKEHTNLRQILN